MLRSLFSSFVFLALLVPGFGVAQTLHQDFKERVPAEVLEIVSERDREITGTGATTTVQEVRAVIEGGDKAGEVVRFEVEVVTVRPGDNIFVDRTVTISGEEYITYADYERRPTLIFVIALFVVMLLVFSGWQGVRAMLSLGGSIAAILFLLVPALLAGYDPVLSSVVISGAILACVLFGTHGIHPRTIIAFVGTFGAVCVTGVVATVSVTLMRLSGFSSDASVYLNFATNGALDLSGLLLGSIIIGILGVLDDVSITQASVVQELKAANPNFKSLDLYKRSIKVGKDHIGSLVNTLALAYVAVSLPLILLYAQTDASIWQTLNQEVIAAEILRIVVGSIGLILAVPLTTIAASKYWSNREVPEGMGGGHHHHHH